ncbi:MAG: hypothetical protein J7647_10605 [Cyanobacteria bacterium SBLK]|nr:hypothetical protein [Cyanobacteria bacterium SBLK]
MPERKRVDGATVNRNFNRVIKDKGGTGKIYARSAEALTEEVMGCKTEALYEQTGAKEGDRSTLPERAQEALLTGEIVASHDLKDKDISGTRSQKNEQIVDSVRDSGRKVRKWFPW